MSYTYYPGCSLTLGAIEYSVSSQAVLERLGAGLSAISDWTCCGASAAESVSRLLSYALPARVLALAEKARPGDDVLVPCSACYLNLQKVVQESGKDKRLLHEINEVLAAEGLAFSGRSRVRHILDVLANDIGPERIGAQASSPLEGLVVAPYYGCQILRPYALFDDPERPASMDALLEALGAEVLAWDMGGRCCGASLMATKREVALASVANILAAAQGADAIVTVCPMCQMNLEAYQKQAFRISGRGLPVAVVYLPQLMGLAFGLTEEEVLLRKNMAVSARFRDRIGGRGRGPAAEASDVNQERQHGDNPPHNQGGSHV